MSNLLIIKEKLESAVESSNINIKRLHELNEYAKPEKNVDHAKICR